MLIPKYRVFSFLDSQITGTNERRCRTGGNWFGKLQGINRIDNKKEVNND